MPRKDSRAKRPGYSDALSHWKPTSFNCKQRSSHCKQQTPSSYKAPKTTLPARLQKLVGEFSSIFCREIWRDIWRGFCRIFSDPQNKGSKVSGKISEHFLREFVPRKTIPRASFVLQTCHPKNNYTQRTATVSKKLPSVSRRADVSDDYCQQCTLSLRGPAAILFKTRDTCSDRIAKLFRAYFYWGGGVSHNYRAISCKMGYRTDALV